MLNIEDSVDMKDAQQDIENRVREVKEKSRQMLKYLKCIEDEATNKAIANRILDSLVASGVKLYFIK